MIHSEQIVYKALRPLEDLGYKIYHSVRFVDDIGFKRDYEADFLICGPKSFMVLEVKGGNIKWNHSLGQATSTDYKGQVYKIDPWKQGLENSYKILEHFNSYFHTRGRRVPIGHTWAAIFPDGKINFKSPGSYSGHREVSWDQRHLETLDQYCIHLLNKYSVHEETHIEASEWDEFHYSCYDKSFKWEPARILKRKEALGVAASDLKLSQSLAPAMASSVPLERVLLEGGPGTGKTALLCQKALQMYAQDSEASLLYICYNNMLAAEVEAFFTAHNVQVIVWEFYKLCEYLCEEFEVDLMSYSDSEDISQDKQYYSDTILDATIGVLESSEAIHKVTHLFVDEAQDLVLPKQWQILNEIHQDPEEGFWWMAWDKRQCIFTSDLPYEECLANLEDSFPLSMIPWPLNINFRNHPKINDQLNESMIWDDPSGLLHLEESPTKNYQVIRCRPESKALAETLADIQSEAKELGVSQLRILSSHTEANSTWGKVSEADRVKFGIDKLPYCTVQKFKGCESDGVILMGFDSEACRDVNSKEHRLFYLGVSRATLKVWVVE